MKLVERQYTASKEGARGYVTLTNISDVERHALDGFYRTYSPPVKGDTKRYSLKKFDRLLKESRFELTIPKLLELLNGEPVLTRREQTERMNAEWRGVIQAAIAESGAADKAAVRWAEGLMEESSPGFRTLRIVFAKSPEDARHCLKHCLAALNRIITAQGNKPVRLPVLAAEITGDAHAMDWRNPLGRLFWWGLTAIQEQSFAALSEDNQLDFTDTPPADNSQAILIREGYRRGGVADDDLSSQVMLYAPELFGNREERLLTLRQVEQLSLERGGKLHYRRIHMVENPSVFAELMDADAQKLNGTRASHIVPPILVCGNGQPTTAVIKLLDALLSQPVRIDLYYSGDLDPAGLGIACGLQLRYPDSFHAWRMDTAQYLRYADRGMPMSENERLRLLEGRYDWDAALAAAMNDKGIKLHQELWIAELLQDLERYGEQTGR
ncbi:TIGR02679 domain-containing protein [Paenibacillus arenilitoris]|uniref:TIGR02679 domain-containing protein n=1 Tax=Paenibacillus arenilitoris TaxID=2772299 RepID=UPI0016856FB3|nr:TIGR02679 domain-containing protein [Paenibacillus arenilitoris]